MRPETEHIVYCDCTTVISRAVNLSTGDQAVDFSKQASLFERAYAIVATCPMAKNAETDKVNSCQDVELV